MINNIPQFQILEVIHFQRESRKIKTDCKNCYVLSYRISGESTFFYNGTTITAKAGDVLYVPLGASYSQFCKSEEIIAIHLDISGNVPQMLRVITPENSDEIHRLFLHIAKLWKENQTNYLYYAMADLYRIIALSNLMDTTKTENQFGVISPAVTYLQTHLYDSELTMEQVYQQCPISQTSFIKYFQQVFHCTPIQYVNQQRIGKAKLLLKSRLYSREEIAALCGFENIKHFYVVFKKITGCTTGEYLKVTK